MISAALNVAGDLFFVVVLGWGSNGCAFSTVLSEALCCLLCGLYIKKKVKIPLPGRKWRVLTGGYFIRPGAVYLGERHAAGDGTARQDRNPGDCQYNGNLSWRRLQS